MQAILFGHGGVSVIGVNACMMGGGALIAYGVWELRKLVSFPKREVIFGGLQHRGADKSCLLEDEAVGGREVGGYIRRGMIG